MEIKRDGLFFVIIASILVFSILAVSAVDNIPNAIGNNHNPGNNNPNNDNNQGKQLQFALGNVKCMSDFTTSYLNDLITLAPSDTLSADVTKLQNDFTQMQTFETNNDTSGLRNYISSNYDPDLKTAKQDAIGWVKINWKNITMEKRVDIRNNHKDLKGTFDTCHFESMKDYGTGRINAFTSILDAYQKKADALKEKGLDTTTLDQVISDAKTQIITPMQNALDSAKDATSAKQALQNYCLYDGCKTGTNFHFQAKWEIAKLDIALARISSNANATQVQPKTTELQTDINNAKTALSSVGTQKYTDTQNKQVWDNIKAANQLVKEIAQTLGGK